MKLNLQASMVYQFQSIEILQELPPIFMSIFIAVEVLIFDDTVGDILMLPMLDEDIDIAMMLSRLGSSGFPPGFKAVAEGERWVLAVIKFSSD